jgi:predicted alpha/beta-hydrolase family hydrolase
MATRRARPGALLLAPGAGSDRNHSCLVAIEHAVAPLPVERMDFPYRKAGKRAPDRAPVLLAAVVEAAGALAASAGVATERIVLGGRSMGGRMCSMAVAGGGEMEAVGHALPARGLVLISYPLHPPGKPDKPRTAHLPAITVPCLFVHGSRDPFGTPDELQAATATVTGPVTHVWLNGGHDLKGRDADVAAAVVDWLGSIP